jgi:hypothetical protein
MQLPFFHMQLDHACGLGGFAFGVRIHVSVPVVPGYNFKAVFASIFR